MPALILAIRARLFPIGSDEQAAGFGGRVRAARELGLADDWAKRVVGAAGSYADIYARNLGDRSRLKLPRGPNAPAEAGGLFVTPYRE